MEQQQQSSFWAIVEVMGHKTLAGEVHSIELAGHGYLRVEIPATKSISAWSKILSPGSIYGITPVDEQVARSVAEQLQERPLTIYGAGDLGRDLFQEAEHVVRQRLRGPLLEDDDNDHPW